MGWRIVDPDTLAEWLAGTSRQGQCETLVAALGSAPRKVVFGVSGELSRVTMSPPTINTSVEPASPRRVEFGQGIPSTLINTATGTPTRVEVHNADGTVILRATAGTSGATVNYPNGAIKALCAPSVGSAGIYIASNGSLPATPDPAIFTFLAGMSSGQCLQYPLPSLTVNVSGKGTPFGPSPSASAGPFDWLCNMPYDPVSKQIILAGGRAAATAAATKVMVFDAEADEAYSFVNPWGVGTGHIYQGVVVIPERRLLFFRGFHTGALLLWNIDTQTDAGITLPAVPSSYRLGENPAWAWYPNWGTYGSLVVVGRDVDTSGVIVGRYAAPSTSAAFNTGTWQPPVYVSGLEGFGPMQIRPDVPSDGSNTDHPAGCYVPAASAGIFGSSSVWTPKKLLVVPSGGATPYWTATTCPAGVSVLYPTGPEAGSLGLMSPHPSRAALVLISRSDLAMYTYDFGSDSYVSRGAAPSVFSAANQGLATIPEADGLVSLHGATGQVADEMWCLKVGTSLG